MAPEAGQSARSEIVEVNPENISKHGIFCVSDVKHPGYNRKLLWLTERFKEGLTIKLLFPRLEKRAAGFIEYMPGERSWRAVQAEGYMMIHCVFIDKRRNKGRGYGSMLLQSCVKDARRKGMKGVAVVTSEGTWMAGPELFLKNGFAVQDEAPPSFKLLVRKFGRSSVPTLKKYPATRLAAHKGLSLLYTHQCPFSARFTQDIEEFAKKEGLKLKLKNLRSSREVQDTPSAYGTFTLIHNGKVLADHPISRTRFANIVRKELPSK